MRFILKMVATLLLSAIAIVIAMQFVTFIWNFPESKPFSGDNFYNPYAGISTGKPYTETFLKANFHGHTCVDTRHDYTTDEFIAAYRDRDYDIIGITDHQTINSKGYIPSYEHGYGLNNFHIGVYDTHKVDWIDNVLMLLPRHQMQSALQRLHKTCDVTVLNHSDRLRLMSCDGIEFLRGYDLFEIPPTATEKEEGGIADIWDRILSTGYYVPLVSNDDAHSINNRNSQFQRAYTMVYGEDGNILSSLKRGLSYGVCLTGEKNRDGHSDLPSITSIRLVNDSISIKFDKEADTVNFIGQNGEILDCFCGVPECGYSIAKNDTYVRIEAEFDGVMVFTNPIARISKRGFVFDSPQANIPYSILNWVVWTLLLALDILIMTKIWRRKKDSHYDRINIGLGLKPLEWY